MMEDDNKDIVITGMSALLPPGPVSSLLNAKSFDPDRSTVSRKLKRCCKQSALLAVEAGERAMHMAQVVPGEKKYRWGFYTGQNGYQHPDFDDLAPALAGVKIDRYEDILAHLWQSRKVNPFLIIHALSNNLLSILSLHWNLQGDCGAFIRDKKGVAGALQEAVFGLSTGVCNIALVINAGMHSDLISRDLAALSKHPSRETDRTQAAACALVLENRAHAIKRSLTPIAGLDLLPCGCYRPDLPQNNVLTSLHPMILDLMISDCHSENDSCEDITRAVKAMLKPRKSIELWAEPTHKGCEGIALNVLIAAHLSVQTRLNYPFKPSQRCLAITSEQNGYVSAALVKGP